MAKTAHSFISRNLFPRVRCEYLQEFADFVYARIDRLEVIPAPADESESAEKAYKAALKDKLIRAVINSEYGCPDGVSKVNAALQLLEVCGSHEATDDLRIYAEAQKKQITRPFNCPLELAMLHLLAGNFSLLRQIEELHRIKKSKSYRVLPSDDNTFPFPLLDKESIEKRIKHEEKQISQVFHTKGMTEICHIQCNQYGNDFWFTIQRATYQETEDEVDSESRELVPHSSNKGKCDIVIFRQSSDCLYVNIDAESKMSWLVRLYAGAIGDILFGASRWTNKNRYTMKPFNQRSIESMENDFSVDGISSVTIFRLRMERPINSRKRAQKEVLEKVFSGMPDRSVSGLAREGESVVPERFVVTRAYFYFRFACYASLTVPLAADSAPLQLDNDAYKLVEQYFEQMGFDVMYNRRQRRNELRSHS